METAFRAPIFVEIKKADTLMLQMTKQRSNKDIPLTPFLIFHYIRIWLGRNLLFALNKAIYPPCNTVPEPNRYPLGLRGPVPL